MGSDLDWANNPAFGWPAEDLSVELIIPDSNHPTMGAVSITDPDGNRLVINDALFLVKELTALLEQNKNKNI